MIGLTINATSFLKFILQVLFATVDRLRVSQSEESESITSILDQLTVANGCPSGSSFDLCWNI